MPFATNADLPDRVKSAIPGKSGKDIFRNVVNSQLARGLSEARSFASAWSSLQRAGFKQSKDGKWIKVEKRIPFDVVGDMPDDIRSKIPSKDGKVLFMDAYNRAYVNGATEGVSFARAWAALSNGGFTPDADGEWNQLSREISENFDGDNPLPDDQHGLLKRFLDSLGKRKKTYRDKKTEKGAFAIGDTVSVDTPQGTERVKIVSIEGENAQVELAAQGDEEAKVGSYKLSELKKSDEVEFTMEAAIIKLDDDKRLVYGWASVIEKEGEPVVDKQGDVIKSADLVEAAHDYMSQHRKAREMHEGVNKGETVSSIVFTHDVQKALGIDLEMVGWFICQKIHDDKLWKRFKSGEISAFSIGGHGQRTDIG